MTDPTLCPDHAPAQTRLPAWATAAPAQTPEHRAFLAGAILARLDPFPRAIPLASRLALRAAVATAHLQSRSTGPGDLRDAWHFALPGALRGPDGELLAFWRRAARLRGEDAPMLARLVGPTLAPQIEGWRRIGRATAQARGPLAGWSAVLGTVLETHPRAEPVACLLADLALAQAMNWPISPPLSAQALSKVRPRTLRANQPGAEGALQTALLEVLMDTIGQAHDLAERAAALQAMAPKLRAKTATAALAVFLSEESVAPATMLAPRIQGTTIAMTDRAARRFCDRLVELGVVYELTGRTSFRLYGL